jgi:hypothetical protein
MIASIPPIKQMHSAVMPTPTNTVWSQQRLLHITLAAGDFRMFHEKQRPIRLSGPDAKPHRRLNNEFDHKTFLSIKLSGKEQLTGRFDDLAPGRLLLAPHSHAMTIAARGKRYGARTLSCPRMQLHHDCFHADATSFTLIFTAYACLQPPSRRSLLQHDEDAKGKVSTQYTQETFESQERTHHPRRDERRTLKAAAERIGGKRQSMVPELSQIWIHIMKTPARSFE